MAKENCIICGVETPYDFETHIDLRDYYVEGAGQLCRSCYIKPQELEEKPQVVKIPISIIRELSNDSDLGQKVRQIYYEQK